MIVQILKEVHNGSLKLVQKKTYPSGDVSKTILCPKTRLPLEFLGTTKKKSK